MLVKILIGVAGALVLFLAVVATRPSAYHVERKLEIAAPAELVFELSNENKVTAETPPCFLWHTVADKTVAVENSLLFASALRQAGVPFSLHIYETGNHGLGLGRAASGTQPARPAPPWADQLLYWFKERKFIP